MRRSFESRCPRGSPCLIEKRRGGGPRRGHRAQNTPRLSVHFLNASRWMSRRKAGASRKPTSAVWTPSLPAPASRSSARTGCQFGGRVAKTRDIERRDRSRDLSKQLLFFARREAAAGGGAENGPAAIPKRRAEDGIVRAQERGKRPSGRKAARRLGEARRREIELGQFGKERKVAEAREERGHEEGRGIRLRQGLPLVSFEARRKRLPAPGRLDRLRQTEDAEESQREPRREQRIHEGGGRGKEGPVLAGGPAASEGKSVAKNERKGRTGFRELPPHRGQAFEEAIPRRRALGEPHLTGQGRGRREAGARDPIVEPENPDPPSLEDVVDRGVVHRIRRFLRRREDPDFVQAPDSGEVRVEALRGGEVGETRLRQIEPSGQRASRPGRIGDKAGGDGTGRPARSPSSSKPWSVRLTAPSRVRSRSSAPAARASSARKASKSARYQCVSATSSFGLAATRSWSLRSAAPAKESPSRWP